MTRRTFLTVLGAAGVALATGTVWLTRRLVPLRVVRAMRGRFFPGKVRPLNEEDIQTPGKWSG